MTSKPPQRDDGEGAYQSAVRLLARRAHSRRELERKLRQRGYGQAAIGQAVGRCEAHSYIDEALICEHYCRELIRKGYGPRMIGHRLASRGLARSLIQETLDRDYPPDAVQATARRVGARKLRQLESRLDPKSVSDAQLARFLMHRGFSAEVVHATIEHLKEG